MISSYRRTAMGGRRRWLLDALERSHQNESRCLQKLRSCLTGDPEKPPPGWDEAIEELKLAEERTRKLYRQVWGHP